MEGGGEETVLETQCGTCSELPLAVCHATLQFSSGGLCVSWQAGRAGHQATRPDRLAAVVCLASSAKSFGLSPLGDSTK